VCLSITSAKPTQKEEEEGQRFQVAIVKIFSTSNYFCLVSLTFVLFLILFHRDKFQLPTFPSSAFDDGATDLLLFILQLGHGRLFSLSTQKEGKRKIYFLREAAKPRP
jgi:hypothetical protein